MENAKKFAIIALVLGILSGVLGLLIALLGYAAAGAAIVLAIIALVQSKYSFDKTATTVCSIIGIVTAAGGFIVSLINSVLGVLINLGIIELPF